jgi:hypothetical protein
MNPLFEVEPKFLKPKHWQKFRFRFDEKLELESYLKRFHFEKMWKCVAYLLPENILLAFCDRNSRQSLFYCIFNFEQKYNQLFNHRILVDTVGTVDTVDTYAVANTMWYSS